MDTPSRPPRIVMLTRSAPDACYIARRLVQSSALSLIAVVSEERTQGQLDLLRHKLRRCWQRVGLLSTLGLIIELPYLFWQDRRLLAAQQQAWWQGATPAFPPDIPHHVLDNLNSPAAVQLLKEIDADLFIVYGTRILRPETFNCARRGAINVHMGITPEYRGSKSEFWALYRDEPEQVGLTVHRIDAGIDTGGVLAQHRVPVTAVDDEIRLRNKNVEAAVGVLETVIMDMHAGKAPTVDVSGRQSRLFSTPSMLQYLRLHRRLRHARSQA